MSEKVTQPITEDDFERLKEEIIRMLEAKDIQAQAAIEHVITNPAVIRAALANLEPKGQQ